MNYKTLTMFILAFYAAEAHAVISGTPHDLMTRNIPAYEGVCEPCHIPHSSPRPFPGGFTQIMSSPEINQGDLWDSNLAQSIPCDDEKHKEAYYCSQIISGDDSTERLDGYSSQRGVMTKLCLSCHDGLYFSAYRGSTESAATDHGISIRDIAYSSESAAANGNLYDPETHTTSLGGTISFDLYLWNDSKMTCTSCHDVHYSSGTSLRIDNTAQQLCLTCHIAMP